MLQLPAVPPPPAPAAAPATTAATLLLEARRSRGWHQTEGGHLHQPPHRGQAHEDDRDHSPEAADDDGDEDEADKVRTSRARLKERLNWFSSRSRARLSSFGSSDNLKYVRDGFLRSRDKLSCALSPVRGRIGSYQFVDSAGSELGGGGSFPSQGSICVRVGTWQ